MAARVWYCGAQVSSGFLVLIRLCFLFWLSLILDEILSPLFAGELLVSLLNSNSPHRCLSWMCWSLIMIGIRMLVTISLIPEYVCPSMPECARVRFAARVDRLRLWSDYLLFFPSGFIVGGFCSIS